MFKGFSTIWSGAAPVDDVKEVIWKYSEPLSIKGEPKGPAWNPDDSISVILPDRRPRLVELKTPDLLVKSMLYNSTRALAERNGLQISTVAWEDTGRTKGSCFGPNISDMTLVVAGSNMPIIRKPNFADVTSDQAMDMFTVNVGNERGATLRTVSLCEYLTNITKYTDIKTKGSLVAARDTHVLTSAQACVLPLRDGKVEFGVKLYNYQSCVEPAVLVIVASSQGTSAHVVLGHDNVLRFNKSGRAAEFVAERLKDDRARRGVATEGAMTTEEKTRNAVLIYQIPLVYHAPVMRPESLMQLSYSLETAIPCSAGRSASRSDRGMDHAVVSTTEGRGEYPSLSKWTVERDTRMPIRCTIQYYHVSDSDSISESEMTAIATEVTKHSPVGSLVVDGSTARPTEHTVPTPSFTDRIATVGTLFGLL